MLGRSIWAVVAGALFAIVAITVIDLALHAAGLYPAAGQPIGDRQALLASSYRLVLGVAGAWITARLAPRNPMKHALVGGASGTAVALAGAIVTWNRDLGPHWYPLSLAVLAIPEAWLGARLFESRRPRQVELA